MASSTHPEPASSSPWLRRLIAGVFVLATAVLVWTQLPKGSYPTDLSRIGQGQAALVITMDGNFMAGVEMLPVLDTLRADLGGQVQFLVASLGLPEGQAFAQRHQTQDGSVVVFDPSGQAVAVLHGSRTAAELRQVLQRAMQGAAP